MFERLVTMRQRHRRLNRQIDNSRAGVSQEEMKTLKRQRLHIKDLVTALQRQVQPPA